jgi:hypothetical protein
MKLTVNNFSCIKSAEIELARLNVLIGPQASGKSVLSKLIYFFLDLHRRQTESILKEESFDSFAESVKLSFTELFPVSAWGDGKFKILFESEDFEVRINRAIYNDELKNSIRLGFSNPIKETYGAALGLVRTSREKSSKSITNRTLAKFRLDWKLTEQISTLVSKKFEKSSPSILTFIPAGRSFFTNLGKAFFAFDQARLLDPITVTFGRAYSTFIADGMFYESEKTREIVVELAQILGGDVHREGDRITIRCPDGRDIPLSALSSGQQELLPLFLTFNFLSSSYLHRTNRDRTPEITIIEEPEAHLFPSAQSSLLQALVGFVNMPRRQILLTTHSPYVLAKINNLIKAGDLERRLAKGLQDDLNEIVPKRARLSPGSVRAYAIVDQVAQPIIDEHGLIAADYLDEISSEIGNEFSDLLALEFQE